MPLALGKSILRQCGDVLADFGVFCTFVGHTMQWLVYGGLSWKNIRLILPQLFDVGVRSVPVISVTGAFIGMVLAVEAYSQFKAIGQENRLGVIINLSVVKQIGPILCAIMLAGRVGGALAAVMLAGRVGGALTAELGTMNVTEQLDALRVMGTDPIRYLVVPRFLACVFLTPILTIFSDFLGILGGWFIAVVVLGIPNSPYWYYSSVENWQIMEGLIKSVFFGASIGLISCYKGFTSGAGASGVGRACTDSFVSSFIAIMILNFIFAKMLKEMYIALYGYHGIFG